MSYNYGEPLEDKTGLKEFEGRDSVDLLARMIYAEAENQGEKGMRACAFVAKNRKACTKSEFKSQDTYEKVILAKSQFSGMSLKKARKPNLQSDTWKTALKIASNMSTNTNPIGGCLWFRTKSSYNSLVETKDGCEYAWNKKVTEKKILKDHVFYKVEGY